MREEFLAWAKRKKLLDETNDEITDHMVAGATNVGKYANVHTIAADHKTMRVNGIVPFWKGKNR